MFRFQVCDITVINHYFTALNGTNPAIASKTTLLPAAVI